MFKSVTKFLANEFGRDRDRIRFDRVPDRGLHHHRSSDSWNEGQYCVHRNRQRPQVIGTLEAVEIVAADGERSPSVVLPLVSFAMRVMS